MRKISSVFMVVCFLVFGSFLAAEEGRFPLSSVDLSKAKSSVPPIQANKNMHGNPMRIAGKEYTNGVGTHAFADIRVAVNGAYRFTAEVGVDDESMDQGSIKFKIFGDDKLLWQSRTRFGGQPAEKVDISLQGIKVLDFAITDAGDNYLCDRANWADAWFYVEGENPAALDLPLDQPLKSALSEGPAEEKEETERWVREHLLEAASPIYTFQYGNTPFSELVSKWKREIQSQKLDKNRNEHIITHTDPETGLVVRCVAVEYIDFPAVEWTVWLKNTGKSDTPIISDLKAVDTCFDPANRYKLYHFMGDYYAPDGYQPYVHQFYSQRGITFSPDGGRPTNVAFPYYKLQGPDSGAVFVVSWQGQWETSFQPTGSDLRVRAGQQDVHCKLLPGEEIRTPMIFFLFYQGKDYDRSQNLWRRWFIAHNIPRVDGELIEPFYANYCGRIFIEMEKATETSTKQYADLFLDNGIPYDYLWMDAGWYPCDIPGSDHNTWTRTGTWKPDPKRFPNGIRAISDHVHERGIKTILWFEPERVMPGTELATEHPDFLIGDPTRGTSLLNLGNPAAREWLTARINSLIQNEGIDLYRQDHNMDPLPFWQQNDAPDRRGITENLHCQGYLKFWDAIIAANPRIVIDSCASGGRRNDLETVRRALPLHKTDYNYDDLTVKHGFHHTLFQWLPFFGSMNAPCDQSDIYYHRSAYALSYHGCDAGVFDPNYDFEKLRIWMDEWREIAPIFYGDFYPLLPYSMDDREWIGWQFHLEAGHEGLVQMFRRPLAPFDQGVFRLKALEPESEYTVKDYNSGKTSRQTGRELMEQGLFIKMTKTPDSALFHYKKIP